MRTRIQPRRKLKPDKLGRRDMARKVRQGRIHNGAAGTVVDGVVPSLLSRLSYLRVQISDTHLSSLARS